MPDPTELSCSLSCADHDSEQIWGGERGGIRADKLSSSISVMSTKIQQSFSLKSRQRS